MSDPSDREPTHLEITVTDEHSGLRLDAFLGNHPEIKLTRSRAQQLIENGLVLVDQKAVAKKYKLTTGEVVSINIPAPERTEITGEDIPIEIVYGDEYLAVINKPPGMVTHPGAGNRQGTLVNALVHHFSSLSHGSSNDRPGIVHRLDKNTSGLLVIARDDDTYQKLQKAIQSREIKRRYLALLCGHLKDEEGTVDSPIGRSMKDRKKMAITHVASREAVTDYRLLKRYRSYDLIEASLQTGRTHQIRVHFAHLGHPVFGDPEYGGRESWHRGQYAPERPLSRKLLERMKRQALHAWRLELVHPVSGEQMKFEATIPDDMQNLLDTLDAEGV